MSTNEEEKKLGKLYSAVASDHSILIPEDESKKPILPEGVTKQDLVDYLTTMAKDLMPRKIRDEGRESTDVEVYAIPANYYAVSSNMVNWNLNEGFYNPAPDAAREESTKIFGKDLKVYNGWQANDMGTFLCLYLFQHGRKTIDELVFELKSYDKKFLSLLAINLQDDDFIKIYKEEDGTETLEILTKKEREDRMTKRMQALEDNRGTA